MKRLIPNLAAATLACAATFAVAHDEQGQGRGAHREQMRAAYEACKDKPDRQACMSEQFCAKAADKARCEAQAKERAQLRQRRLEERQKAHEACNGKRGEELGKCLGEQRQTFGRRAPQSRG